MFLGDFCHSAGLKQVYNLKHSYPCSSRYPKRTKLFNETLVQFQLHFIFGTANNTPIRYLCLFWLYLIHLLNMFCWCFRKADISESVHLFDWNLWINISSCFNVKSSKVSVTSSQVFFIIWIPFYNFKCDRTFKHETLKKLSKLFKALSVPKQNFCQFVSFFIFMQSHWRFFSSSIHFVLLFFLCGTG